MRVRKRMITVQPSEFVDQIVDGEELTKLPYPMSALADGSIWPRGSRGDITRMVGFVRDLRNERVDLYWEFEFLDDPQQAVGMYLITQNADGTMSSHGTAIKTVTEREITVEEADVVIEPGTGPTPDGKNRMGDS